MRVSFCLIQIWGWFLTVTGPASLHGFVGQPCSAAELLAIVAGLQLRISRLKDVCSIMP
jgi:hypothetical protein